MTVQLERQLFTVDDYYKMAELGIISNNVELLNGDIIKMSPTKSHHASIVDTLGDLLPPLGLRDTIKARIQNPVRLNAYSEPEPDVALVKRKKDKYRHQHPQPEDIYLLIEVADATLEKDRQLKSSLYANAGILEYWIVNLLDYQVEVYRKPLGGEYLEKKTFQLEDKLSCSTLNFSLKVEDIFT